MAVSLKGYVLEPPRVGGSNSAYTLTPNDLIADQADFDSHYTPGSETEPRTEYLVLVQTEGLLVDARFGWTKNEGMGPSLWLGLTMLAETNAFRLYLGLPSSRWGLWQPIPTPID